MVLAKAFLTRSSYGRIKSMKTQVSVASAIAALLFNNFVLTTASAHPMIQAWQNRTGSGPGFSLAPKISYFSTNSNYDLTSQSIPLANIVSVKRYYIDLNASYGFDENFFIFGRLSALYTNITGVGLTDQTAFGLNDQMVGAAYRVFQNNSGMSISLQGEITIPAYTKNSAIANSKPYMGDESYDFTGGAFAELPLTTQPTYQVYLDGGAGYTYRSYGYSACIPWNVQVKYYPVKSGLLATLGLRGSLSLETDTSLYSRAAEDQLRGAGGSYIINAINPSWTLFQASAGYQTSDNIQFILSGATPLSGKNIANGSQFSFGMQFDFGGGKDKKGPSEFVRHGAFKQYDVEAKVLSTNDQLYLVKIDQGSDRGIEKGQIFDIFAGNETIAKAKVTNVKSDESVLRVLEYYKEKSIEVDAVAKRVVQEP